MSKKQNNQVFNDEIRHLSAAEKALFLDNLKEYDADDLVHTGTTVVDKIPKEADPDEISHTIIPKNKNKNEEQDPDDLVHEGGS